MRYYLRGSTIYDSKLCIRVCTLYNLAYAQIICDCLNTRARQLMGDYTLTMTPYPTIKSAENIGR
jgi:hypothetical protein